MIKAETLSGIKIKIAVLLGAIIYVLNTLLHQQ